jgi:hypothetical protein
VLKTRLISQANVLSFIALKLRFYCVKIRNLATTNCGVNRTAFSVVLKATKQKAGAARPLSF